MTLRGSLGDPANVRAVLEPLSRMPLGCAGPHLVQFVQHGGPMHDPLIHAVATTLFAVVVVIAAAMPAVRATTLSPAGAVGSYAG